MALAVAYHKPYTLQAVHKPASVRKVEDDPVDDDEDEKDEEDEEEEN